MSEQQFFDAAGAAEYLGTLGIKISVRSVQANRARCSSEHKTGWPFYKPFGRGGSLVISKESLNKIAAGKNPWD